MDTIANGKPASRRQLAYIRQLRAVIGDVGPVVGNNLTSVEASQVIEKLVGRLRQSGVPTGIENRSHVAKINEPRLGMAMKECFRIMAGNGWDVCGDNRKAFIEKVIRTYYLFSEVAERLEDERQQGNEVVIQISQNLEPSVVEEVVVA